MLFRKRVFCSGFLLLKFNSLPTTDKTNVPHFSEVSLWTQELNKNILTIDCTLNFVPGLVIIMSVRHLEFFIWNVQKYRIHTST